jgi:hypothetical protein
VVEVATLPPLDKGFRYACTYHRAIYGTIYDHAYTVEVLDSDDGRVTAFRVKVDKASGPKIFFRIVEERAEVVIAGMFHQRQDPALWPER